MANGDITIVLDLRGNADVDRRLQTTRRNVHDLASESDQAGRKATLMGRMFSGAGSAIQSVGRIAATAVRGFAALTAAVGAAALTIGYRFTQAASDAAETRQAFDTVFQGDPLEGINAYVEETNHRFGIANTQLREAALTFGVFGQAAGIAQGDLDDFSSSLVTAGLDLSSFHNANPQEVFEALRSGLSGEAEPLRRFGIFLSEASLQAFALEQGIGTAVSAMSEQEKVALRQQFILASLGAAHGDLARTADSLANQQRRLSGIWQDNRERIGTALMPVLEGLTRVTAELAGVHLPNLAAQLEAVVPSADVVEAALWRVVDRAGDLITTFRSGGLEEALVSVFGEESRGLIEAVGDILEDIGLVVVAVVQGFLNGAAGMREVLPWFRTPLELLRDGLAWLAENRGVVSTFGQVLGTVVPVLGAVAAGVAAVNLVMSANPIVLVVGALAALVAGLVHAYRTSDDFRARVDAVWQWLQQAAGWLRTNVLEPLVVWWSTVMWPTLQAVAAEVAPILAGIVRNIGGTIQAVWTGIIQPAVDWFTSNWPRISNAAGRVWELISPIVDAIVQAHEALWHNVLEPLLSFWVDTLWPGINTAISEAGPVVTGILEAILDHVEWLISGVETAASAVSSWWDALVEGAQEAWELVQPIIDNIRSGFETVTDVVDRLNPFSGGTAPRNVLPVEPRATGGPVAGGMPYRVGELGPELFVPNTSGWILNHRQTAAAAPQLHAVSAAADVAPRRGGDGATFHITLHATFDGDGTTDRQRARNIGREIADEVRRQQLVDEVIG